MWLNAIKVKAKPQSKETANPETAVPKKLAACYRFNDGTTQNWVLDQLYDSKPDPKTNTQKKIAAYFPFVLLNSQNIALAASVDPLIVTDPTVMQCDIYFDSPDLSMNADWQGIDGYSLDLYRTLASEGWDSEDLYLTQMNIVLIDTTDNSLHTFGEHNGDFIFHPIKYKTPYHFIWKPSVLSDPKYKVKRLRIRMTMPGYLGPGGGELAPKGKWLIGNVCPEK